MKRILFIPFLLLFCTSVLAQTAMQWADGDPVMGSSLRTVSTPAAGSGVTAYFTTDLAPTRPFQASANGDHFYTTWTTTNSPATAGSISGGLHYCNDLKNPSQGVLYYIDRPGGNAHLDIITAYNPSTGATTRTSLINTAVTFVDGKQLVFVYDKTAAKGWLIYNSRLVGISQDLSAYSSWLNVNSKHSLFSTTAVTPGSVVYDFKNNTLGNDLCRAGVGMSNAGATIYWVPEGANTVQNDAGQIKITYVNSGFGGDLNFNAASALTSNLTVGALYRYLGKTRVSAAGNVSNLMYNGLTNQTMQPSITSTTLVDFMEYFIAGNATTCTANQSSFDPGESIWFDMIIVQQVQ